MSSELIHALFLVFCFGVIITLLIALLGRSDRRK